MRDFSSHPASIISQVYFSEKLVVGKLSSFLIISSLLCSGAGIPLHTSNLEMWYSLQVGRRGLILM